MSDIDSVCSNISDMSVSYCGEEMDAEQFVDTAFKELQTALNNLHCVTRNLMMCEDRGDSYDDAKQLFDEIQETVKDGISVFKEILKTNKQFMPPKPKVKPIKE
jgi:hypothetical protein